MKEMGSWGVWLLAIAGFVGTIVHAAGYFGLAQYLAMFGDATFGIGLVGLALLLWSMKK